MVLRVRLARGGAKKRPFYRVVVAQASSPRDGRFIEKLGFYNPMVPKNSPDYCRIDCDKVRYWVSVGAHCTTTVQRLLKLQGTSSNPNTAEPDTSEANGQHGDPESAIAQS